MQNSEYEQWQSGNSPRVYDGSSVRAVRIDGSNTDDVVAWLRKSGVDADIRDGAVTFGHMIVDVGEWVVLSGSGHALRMDDATFGELFEQAPPPMIGG
ncbi:hypothetical protein ACIGGF_21075 [Rhodococcus sp. NPDC078407]|uniref:hypothetical protein n=1 Tax=Rhodococcus sp. NPDC078407 TaxID=3364509 RepID=UPI0037CAE31D